MCAKNSLSIAVIDDSPTICHILEGALARHGHQVSTFVNPIEALRALVTADAPALPDVLFVDLLFHEQNIDGYEVIRRFRSHPQGQRLPIVVISRLDGVHSWLRARLVGATDYVVKPFKVQEIETLVQRYADNADTTPS